MFNTLIKEWKMNNFCFINIWQKHIVTHIFLWEPYLCSSIQVVMNLFKVCWAAQGECNDTELNLLSILVAPLQEPPICLQSFRLSHTDQLIFSFFFERILRTRDW